MKTIYNIYLTTFIACIGGVLFGFDISSVSAFVDDDNYLRYFNSPDSTTQGGITSSMSGGSFLGSLVVGMISDKFGRKFSIEISSIIWCIGAAIQSSSQNRAQLICGRVIGGFAIGFASAQVPVYVSEISPKKIRGSLGCSFQWSVTLGILIMFYLSFGCSKIKGVGSFRLAWGLQIIPGILLFIGIFFLPESPRWLAAHDRWQEAVDIVAKVQAKNNPDDPIVLIELEEIRDSIKIEKEAKKMSYIELFSKKNINRSMVGIFCQIWQQLTGMNVLMYYIVYIFASAGYTGNTNLVASSIQYVLNTVMTIPALIYIDHWGRRPLLYCGSFIMMIWLFAIAGLLAVWGEKVDAVDGNENVNLLVHNKKASRAIIACCYLFVCTFAPTWGPGAWLYCSEIFPTRQRAKATALTTAADWILNFAIGMFTPPAFHNITWKTYIIFAVFCFCMTIHVFLLFPETKGKSLEEINQMWEAKLPAWRTSSWVPVLPDVTNKNLTDIKGRDLDEEKTFPSQDEST